MNKKLLFPLLLAFCLMDAIHAQNAYLSGSITDDLGDFLPGVTVEAKGFGSTYTDEDGYFLLPLKPGTYDIEFRYLGLDTHKVAAFHVAGNTVRQLDVVMNAYSNWLAEVTIVAFKVPFIKSDTIFCGYTSCRCDCVHLQPAASTAQRTPSENDSLRVAGGISLYPNPADTYTQLELAVPAQQVAIFDTKGTLVHRMHDLPAGIHIIPTRHLPAGIYAVTVSTDSQKQSLQLVIAHD